MQTKMGSDMMIEGAEDLISNLPDEILQHILCFVPTKVSISTSLLSRRWRHVWCEVPSISLDDTTAASVGKTLTGYTAPKTKRFELTIESITNNTTHIHIDRLIKFAMSRNVEYLFLSFHLNYYEIPDFFYNTSSFKELDMSGCYHKIVPPRCTVSWTSLQKLSLRFCRLSDESMAKLLSGCPVLENLTLSYCRQLSILDLSKSLRLRTLEVIDNVPEQIVAPHIHYLRLYDPPLSCSLVDVASLAEARLEVYCVSLNSDIRVLKMLDKLKNAEKLKFGRNFIEVLSVAEIRGVPFPTLKVKVLTLDTMICQYVIPGIERLLQNSPDLEKLTITGRSSILGGAF